MPRGKTLQTVIPGFGRIYQPTYRDKKTGELKHSGIWWMEIRTSSGPVYRSTKQRDQAAAYAELMRQAGRAGHGEISDATPERITFDKLLTLLIADYENRQRRSTETARYLTEIHLRPFFGTIRVIDLRKADVERFKREMLESGRSPATVNRCLSALRRALQVGADEDPPLVVRQIPRWFTKLDESEGVRSGLVTPEMYESLKPAFIAFHARLAFVIGYHTGLRRGAILGLRWEWVDLRAGVIRIPRKQETTKLQPRVVPILGDMAGYLEMAATMTPTGCPWVVNLDGRHVDSLKTAWRNAFQRAGFVTPTGKPLARFHDLRRTAATMLHEAGVGITEIMDICGWKSVEMPKRYIQQTVKQARRVATMVETHMAAQKTKARDESAKERPM